MSLLSIALTIICLIFLAWLVVTLVDWSCSLSDTTRIKFKSFVKFYDVNPVRWDLHDEHVNCHIDDMSWTTNVESFSFGFIDFIRYKFWLKMQKRAKRNKQHAESTSRMIAAVRRDIDKQNEAAKRKQDEAINIIIELMKNTHASAGGNNRLDKILEEVKNL